MTYTKLAALVERVEIGLPGWTITWDWYMNRVSISWWSTDSRHPEDLSTHKFGRTSTPGLSLTDEWFDETQGRKFVRECILRCMIHEADEHTTIDGKIMFDPHATDDSHLTALLDGTLEGKLDSGEL